jgi:hypothetical protein
VDLYEEECKQIPSIMNPNPKLAPKVLEEEIRWYDIPKIKKVKNDKF